MAVLRLAGVGVSAGSGGPVARAGGVAIGPAAIIALSTQARSVAAASAAQAMLPVAAALLVLPPLVLRWEKHFPLDVDQLAPPLPFLAVLQPHQFTMRSKPKR